MITIQGKEFRNFAEQINKNKEDIANSKVIPTPQSVSETDLKAYLLLLSYEDEQKEQGYAYSILYLTPTQANEMEVEQKLVSHIILTFPNKTSDVFSYLPQTNSVKSLFDNNELLISTIHLEELTY